MNAARTLRIACLLTLLIIGGKAAFAQTGATVNARIDATKITVGDPARIFIDVQHDAATSELQWAVIPDSFNNLEVLEKGGIDTVGKGGMITYRQRIQVTGFDSGMHMIPSFAFTVIPKSGNPYVIKTDSIELLVQTVPVDTTKGFRDIKGIREVQTSWLDYIWYIVAGLVFLAIAGYVIWYFRTHRKTVAPAVFNKVQESLQAKALRLLGELDREQLWQNGKIKEYYTRLTDILRQYIEERFKMPAMELTTDELLSTARGNYELHHHISLLGQILTTADMAKFARAQPTMQEHVMAMENARQFIKDTEPVDIPTTPQKS
ncbi:MAG: hypothetical protein EOP56_01170 [Sphingobacteriales bacterium]|nr:MAG: hypothetical protein EOP56_01170 [Sphingobacteriales bacterium]